MAYRPCDGGKIVMIQRVGAVPEAEKPVSDRPTAGKKRPKVEFLDAVLHAHKLWLAGREGKRACLDGADLRGARLTEADLRKADLRRCCLAGADLRSARLKGANLQGAQLDGAYLQGADLEEARLTGARLQDADLRQAYLGGTSLKGLDLDGADLDGTHLQRADLREARLAGARLSNAFLQGARLEGADLNKADLKCAVLAGASLGEAVLDGANLECADFEDADLRKTRLEGANLGEANLRGTLLAGARLRNASLQDADLRGARGLAVEQLAGANISGARLPQSDVGSNDIVQVDQASRHARYLFLAILGGCIYSLLTVAATTDAALVADRPTFSLPIIRTRIPLVWFYVAAPVALFGLYIYFHLYLQRLWEKLAGLPALFPDGRSVDEKVNPWLLNGLVRVHAVRLEGSFLPLCRLQKWLCSFLAWWLVPTLMLLFLMRCLIRHDGYLTGLHVVIVLASIQAGVVLQRLAGATLRGEGRMRVAPLKSLMKGRALKPAALLLGISAVVSLSLGDSSGINPWALVADLEGADVSVRPVNWAGGEAETVLVKGASLQGANLRGARANGAFLVKADLRGADLRGASLRGAFLMRADLRGADFKRTFLDDADLSGADLRGADLSLAKGLTSEQIGTAVIDAATLLPPGIDDAR